MIRLALMFIVAWIVLTIIFVKAARTEEVVQYDFIRSEGVRQ